MKKLAIISILVLLFTSCQKEIDQSSLHRIHVEYIFPPKHVNGAYFNQAKMYIDTLLIDDGIMHLRYNSYATIQLMSSKNKVQQELKVLVIHKNQYVYVENGNLMEFER